MCTHVVMVYGWILTLVCVCVCVCVLREDGVCVHLFGQGWPSQWGGWTVRGGDSRQSHLGGLSLLQGPGGVETQHTIPHHLDTEWSASSLCQWVNVYVCMRFVWMLLCVSVCVYVLVHVYVYML